MALSLPPTQQLPAQQHQKHSGKNQSQPKRAQQHQKRPQPKGARNRGKSAALESAHCNPPFGLYSHFNIFQIEFRCDCGREFDVLSEYFKISANINRVEMNSEERAEWN